MMKHLQNRLRKNAEVCTSQGTSATRGLRYELRYEESPRLNRSNNLIRSRAPLYNVSGSNGLPDITFDSASRIRGLIKRVYCITACCVRTIRLSWVLRCIGCTTAHRKRVEKCTSKQRGTRVQAQSPGCHSYHHSVSTHDIPKVTVIVCVHLPFRLRSPINRAFHPGIIVWLPAAIAAA